MSFGCGVGYGYKQKITQHTNLILTKDLTTGMMLVKYELNYCQTIGLIDICDTYGTNKI